MRYSPDPEWRGKAACLGMWDSYDWSGGGDKRTSPDPRRICVDCPVKVDCLIEQIRWESDHPREARWGIFGGYTAKERSDMMHRKSVQV